MHEVDVLESFRRLDIDRLRRCLDPSGVYSDVRTPVFLKGMVDLFDDLKSYHHEYFLRDMFYYPIISEHIRGDERGYAYMDSEHCCILLLKLTVKNKVVVNVESMSREKLGTFSLEFYAYQKVDFEHLSIFEIVEEDKLGFDEASLPYEVAVRNRAINEIRDQNELAPIELEFLKKWYTRFKPFSCDYEPDSEGRFFRINETFKDFIDTIEVLFRWEKNKGEYQQLAKNYKNLNQHNKEEMENWYRFVRNSVKSDFSTLYFRLPFVVLNDSIQHLGVRIDVGQFEDVIFIHNRYSELWD